MKITILYLLFELIFFFPETTHDLPYAYYAVNSEADSLELVEFYNSTGGENWDTAWDLNQPMSTWHGVTLDYAGNVKVLDLSNNNLEGSLIDFNLPYLTGLYCSSNQLTGNIPDFANIPKLIFFQCNDNQLTGSIPDFSNLENLANFNCRDNQLTGNIPNFTNLPNLLQFRCQNNSLTGSIPDFSNMSSLTHFHCGFNQLTVSIPDFSNTPNLIHLYCNNNQLTGNIPDFTNLPNLTHLICDHNFLTGSIPDFTNLPNLTHFHCNYNEITDSIPDFNNLSNLQEFYCNHNLLTGNVPDFSNLTNLTIFSCRNNKLTFSNLIATYQSNADQIDTLVVSPQDTLIMLLPEEDEVEEGFFLVINLDIDALDSNIYTWYRNNIPIDTIIGHRGLNIINALPDDEGTYRCEITNTIVTGLILETNDTLIKVLECPETNTNGTACYDIIPNELIIDLSNGLSSDSCESKHNSLFNYLVTNYGNLDSMTIDTCNCDCLFKVTFNSDSLTQYVGIHEIKKGMQSALDVDISYEYKQRNPDIRVTGESDEPYQTQGNPDLDMNEFAVVYIIDTGLEPSEVETIAYAKATENLCSDNYNENLSYSAPSIGGVSPYTDTNGHGTKMYKVIDDTSPNVGRYGVAKVISDSGVGTTFDWTCSIYHAIQHNKKIEEKMSVTPDSINTRRQKIRIINSSLGWVGRVNEDSVIIRAIMAADNEDIIIVASAGNDGLDLDSFPRIFPACYNQPNVITVGAIEPDETMPDFSNRGANHVDIVAPGVNIKTISPNAMDGTSPAAAFVSGQLAYVAAQHPFTDNDSIIQILYNIYADTVSSLVNHVKNGRILLGAVEGYYNPEEIEKPNKMLIYPNPSKGSINIAIPDISAEKGEITIRTPHGMIIYKTSVDILGGRIEGINLGHLSKGVYILTLNDGKSIASERIMIN